MENANATTAGHIPGPTISGTNYTVAYPQLVTQAPPASTVVMKSTNDDSTQSCAKTPMTVFAWFEMAVRICFVIGGFFYLIVISSEGIDQAERNSESKKLKFHFTLGLEVAQIFGITTAAILIHACHQTLDTVVVELTDEKVQTARVECICAFIYHSLEFIAVVVAIVLTEVAAARDSRKCRYWNRRMKEPTWIVSIGALVLKGTFMIMILIYCITMRKDRPVPVHTTANQVLGNTVMLPQGQSMRTQVYYIQVPVGGTA